MRRHRKEFFVLSILIEYIVVLGIIKGGREGRKGGGGGGGGTVSFLFFSFLSTTGGLESDDYIITAFGERSAFFGGDGRKKAGFKENF